MKLFDLLRVQRRVIYLAVALLSVAGIWMVLRLPSAVYPELLFPRVTIVIEGTALGARQVVFSVTRPIEEAVGIVPGIQRVASTSIRGESEINLYFVPSTDMDRALAQVQARVNQVRAQLPSDVDIEIERLTPSVFPILSYNLEGGDPATLNDIARYRIRPLLTRIPGVGRVDVLGSDIREIEVVADPSRLAAQGMTYNDLADAIAGATGVDAVGRVAQDYRQYLVVSDLEAHTIDDIGAVVLKSGLRVRDIATVSLGTEDHTRVIAGDGRPAAQINVTRQISGNTVSIADSVARVVAAVGPTLPPGVHLKPVYDQAALVRAAVTSVRDAMLIGAVLAIVVLLLFLRKLRITAISAASIPLTLAITVFVMSRIGQTFNLMTLGAMAIAIGLVIDDAVVITENIMRHFVLTRDRTAAIRDAVQELIWPVTTSTLTTVVVFLPLGLLQGVVGQFFTALSITLTIAVLTSLVLALTIIPLLSEQFLHGVMAEPKTPAIATRVVNWYERSLDRVVRHPWWTVTTAVVLMALGGVVYQFVGTGFLPEMDEGAFVLDYYTPGGTALAESDRLVRIAEGILAREPEITGTSRRLGAEMGLFATEQNKGDIVARLAPEHDRSRSSFEIMDDARVKINRVAPRLRIEFAQILSDMINDLAGAARPVEIKLFGDSLETLEGYATSMMPDMQKVDGLEDLYSGVSEPAAELQLQLKPAEISRIGLEPAAVDSDVAGALLGVPAGELRREDHAIGVRVRAPDSVRYDPGRLGLLPIIGAKAHGASSLSATPLSALMTVRATTSRAELDRENQQQMIAMTADVSDRSLGAVMADVKQVLAHHPAPKGIRIEIGGQYANQQAAFRSMVLVLALAVISVVAIMLIQFQSFVEPLVIVLAAPISFVGGFTLLWVTGTALNVSSLMGLILLVGLIVKNGIILLDFTRHRMLTLGEPLEQAIRLAARVRLRPILMTTLCTLFGLLPLALGLGAGSALQRPLALTVIGGLALSTPITLYVVPTIVVALRRRRDGRR